jgi:hypothetical protein
MDTFLISQDLIPSGLLSELDVYTYITFKLTIKNQQIISKGEVIGQVELKRNKLGYHGEFSSTIRVSSIETLKVIPIISEYNGYVCNLYNSDNFLLLYYQSNIRTISFTSTNSLSQRQYELYCFETIEELIEHVYPTSGSIINDSYTSSSRIEWSIVSGHNFGGHPTNCDKFHSEGRVIFSLSIRQNTPHLNVSFFKKQHPFSKYDTIYFKMEDESVLSIEVPNTPYKRQFNGCDSEISIPISSKELNVLKSKKWESLKVVGKGGDISYVILNRFEESSISRTSTTQFHNYEYPLSGELFKSYVNQFVDLLGQLGIDLNEKSNNDSSTSLESPGNSLHDEVYVYLMVDTTNNFYKIGISNHPEYRERTLQSEKPTIEMICCKKFPTRELGRFFEQSLHRLYSSKRIRGEWFNLDETDVRHLKEMLQ